ncbi:HNH endonuclease [Hydrogenovibrio thermophilus]|uniref:HNH domain-containing protein n=1 Tax=Hydrogenovibrio thermophilus TaxID=265883 RepID=A0A410H2Q2_9GAMM|nr:HNH endonuclease [Hydrogenovibrio thermophilus]QAB15192.1 hypothetical protein EPV75_05680 [Hydrogenovibrio thermophilus]
MRFGQAQKQKFGTKNGSYSIVTRREYVDSQITLTDYEAELVINHFGASNLHVGNVRSDRLTSSKSFKLYPDGRNINLNIVYPKPEKTELRLYISSGAGFKPEGGRVWFMFVLDDELWIGDMSELEWRMESSVLKMDEFDAVYQEGLDESREIKIQNLKKRDIYARDRNIALKSMELSEFKCEFDSSHDLFLSRFSGKPYLEAHHLIPMGVQQEFATSLDIVDNVCCLCPNCHRAVHHAEKNLARDILNTLADNKDVLDRFSLDVNDLYSFYAVEEIQ